MAAADALVSKLVDKLVSTIHQESILVVGVEQEVQKLISSLKFIQLGLIDAERRQRMEENVQLWLDTVKSVAYEVDDVVDEWSYKILKSQNTSKVYYFNLLSASYCFPWVVTRHRIAVKIRNLNARLGLIAVERETFCFQSLRSNDEQVECNSTIYDIDITGVKGRDTEKEKIVNLLLAESSELPMPHLISILGMEGVGQTTLAKLVYNDEKVQKHFDKRIWVGVSEPFKKFRNSGENLESLLVGHTPNLVKLQSIAMKIQRSIKGKKVLLVLDDVWNEDPKKWKELGDHLVGHFSGYKILVTRHAEKVAKLTGCIDVKTIQVGLLSNEECWSLFSEIAFYRRSSEERQNLESIGVKILARCKGLPLVLKSIAGLLSFKKSRREWEIVLDSDLWKLKVFDRGILGPLWLSYNDLPSSLKQCFLYCAIFPKGFRLSKDELVSLWMAHGFLKPTKDRDMEMVGYDYFHNLGMRSLFQDFEVEEKFNGLNKTYCKMHDMVHNLAEFVMKKECLCIDVNNAEEVTSSGIAAYSDGVYHLLLGEKFKFIDSFCNLGKLRSLVVFPRNNDSSIGTTLPYIFNQLTCLRSLSLSGCRLENIPSNINNLIHLRWLKLSKNYALKELPETICELYNLQTLSVNWCNGLIHFPKGVEKLSNLRHLKNDHTYILLPKGIRKLCGLRKLLRITINPKFRGAFHLRDLENLNFISGSLTIFFIERERNTLVRDAKKAQLKEKKHITALCLNLPERAAEEWMQQEDQELVEALKPSQRLEVLRISCYKGANCPSWINTLTSLKKLKLWYWSNCVHLPALAKLPCLEYVEFNNFGRVKKVTAEFLRMDDYVGPSSSTAPLFPKLTNLQFMNMIEWEEWNDYDGDEDVMPCLSHLSVENCPKLKAMPNFIRKKSTLHKKII